ncbi:MAG: hypothetical protein A2505_00365 [Deltaproteobacteria bacterium RIFOXYD12_FULL_55_16]|nr:MAG: hypothetical protein A2505_00365 [Deltaproteobacteria bacterium RIFOXYD12_FULL_55_16]
MKNPRCQIEDWLNTLLVKVPARQRPLLFIGLFFLSLLLVWLLLLAPVSSAGRKLRQEIGVQEQELAWMRLAAQEIKRYALDTSQGASWQATIEDSARRFGLAQAVRRIEPAAGCGIRVWLEDAVFDDLLRWLSQLKQGPGLEVVEIVVEPGRINPAKVNVQLTLARGD